MTAQYLERFLNYGLTRDELLGGPPIIGVAQTGSDLVPCKQVTIACADPARKKSAGDTLTLAKRR